MKITANIGLSMAVVLLSGCAQSLFNSALVEKRVVQQFADAVTEENESALRQVASTRFENTAMATEDALSDLRIVHLPTGELSVVDVKKTGKDRREVVVREESGTKYQFQLVHDAEKRRWVVDDVLIRQTKRGTRTTRSTTEVMELLLTLRRFLSVWEQGSREEILELTSPELRSSLAKLPDNWLKSLTSRIASAYEEGMARKPEANLTDQDAVVKLPARNGHLMIQIVRNEDRWLVDDVELHNHRDKNHPGSVRRQADAINTVHDFLAAYRDIDRSALEKMTARDLFEESLRDEDLSMVPLPDPGAASAEYDIRAYEDQITFMIPAGREVLRLDLKERENATAADSENGAASRFVIQELKLYDKDSRRQRTLATVFTAPTRASLFLQGLAKREPTELTQMSTSDFSKGTWKRASAEVLAALPVPDLYGDGLQLIDAHTLADRTDLQFRNSHGRLLSCRMRQQAGSLRVDDVQYPDDSGNVLSLKTQLELRIPVLEFALGWKKGEFDAVRRCSSSEFNRLVWSHLEGLPPNFKKTSEVLQLPILSTRVTQERATVAVGLRKRQQAVVRLVSEHGYWVVDEVEFEDRPGHVVAIRKALRREISEKILSGSYSVIHSDAGRPQVLPADSLTTAGPVRQVAATERSDDLQRSGVQTAVYETSPEEMSSAAEDAGSQDHRDHGLRRSVPSGNRVRTADYRVEHSDDDASAHTRTGVTVFGPAAKEVVRKLEASDVPQSLRPDMPIDMTEDESPASTARKSAAPAIGTRAEVQTQVGQPVSRPENESSTQSEDGLLYFGPEKDRLARKNSGPDAAAVREPADAPIPID